MALAAILPGIGGARAILGATSRAVTTMMSAATGTGIRGAAKYQLAFHARVTTATVMPQCHGPSLSFDLAATTVCWT